MLLQNRRVKLNHLSKGSTSWQYYSKIMIEFNVKSSKGVCGKMHLIRAFWFLCAAAKMTRASTPKSRGKREPDANNSKAKKKGKGKRGGDEGRPSGAQGNVKKMDSPAVQRAKRDIKIRRLTQVQVRNAIVVTSLLFAIAVCCLISWFGCVLLASSFLLLVSWLVSLLLSFSPCVHSSFSCFASSFAFLLSCILSFASCFLFLVCLFGLQLRHVSRSCLNSFYLCFVSCIMKTTLSCPAPRKSVASRHGAWHQLDEFQGR